MLSWQQLLSDTPQNLISCRTSWGKHSLKIWRKSVQGFRLWNTHKPYACCRRPDGAGDDYNPSLYGLGLKMKVKYFWYNKQHKGLLSGSIGPWAISPALKSQYYPERSVLLCNYCSFVIIYIPKKIKNE